MSRVRLSLVFVLLLGLGCEHETFELLPPPEEAPQAGMAGGGRGGAGGAGAPASGRGGRDDLPTPDCPETLSVPCRACRTHSDCEFGTLCDTYRDYCAPYCDQDIRCFEPPVCDGFRSVCVECTLDTHCGPLECDRGKCVTPPPPECFTNADCENPAEPFCFQNQCGPCFSSEQCGPGFRCSMGRCEPLMMSPN